MEKRLQLWIGTIAILFFLSSCSSAIKGKGPETTQVRTLESFTELTLDIPANVTLVISDSIQCVITAQQNILDLIEIKQDGDEITIDSKENYKSEKPVDIVISTKALEKISLNGSGNIESLNSIKSNDLKLFINGSGNIKLNCTVNNLRSEINGSGNLTLSGKANEHHAEINGSGNLNAFDLSVDDYKVNLTGSGDAEISANAKLNATLVGSGNIKYKGSPELKSEITGSGEISKRN